MRKICLLIFISLRTVCSGQAQNAQNMYLIDSLEVIQKRVEKLIIPTRYMAQKLISTTDTMQNWENIQVSLYEYTVDKGNKTGRVYMANADAKTMATWIITTCYILTNKLEKKNTDYLIRAIRNASGGQFPIKGIVYENMDGKEYVPYIFKDGVTVFLNSNINEDLSLITNSNIHKIGKYSRIISTTREQYNILFPERDTHGAEWLNVVREEYKSALASGINKLMIAWAKDKLQ